MKMRCILVFMILLDVSPLRGQQRIEETENILLRFYFPSVYNSYNKFCCKLYPGRCLKLLDSEGYTCDLLKGRVTQTVQNGLVEFRIWNVRSSDGGLYRCLVLGSPDPVFTDYYVEISESSHDHSESQPVLTASTTVPESTGPEQAQDQSHRPRISWSFALPLAIIVSTTAMICITSVIAVVYCRVKAKRRLSRHTMGMDPREDKNGDTPRESLRQDAPEPSAVVYTTVDFTAHQKEEKMYANLRMAKGRAAAERVGMVEYSTLALR